MFLVQNYILAILCCIVCMTCWGSWANTQKMAAKSWRFELFYWDFTIGLMITAALAAATLGSFGSDGQTFIDNLCVASGESIGYAMLGGAVWNLGNILLTAAIAVAGMSIGFPIGGGLAWLGGIIFNYLLILTSGSDYPGNEELLYTGIAIIAAAILISGLAYKKLTSKNKKTPSKGILLALFAGIAIMFFFGLVVKSLDPNYVKGGTGTLTPYAGVFFFAIGVLLTTPLLNSLAMRFPVEGKPVQMSDYFRGNLRTHLIGVLGGVIWMSGMVISFMGAGAANPAIAYALSNAAPVVAMLWGVFVWKEFKGAPRGTTPLLIAMFVLFLIGLTVITLSNT